MSGMNGTAPSQTPLITITLNLDGWNVVLNCLAKQPWEVVDPLIQFIRQHIGTTLQQQHQQNAGPREQTIPVPDQNG